ncbi:MAG: TIM barrel protein [Clostridia bacterium]|nr:TIM barrel protein [Clostridia bacterium]
MPFSKQDLAISTMWNYRKAATGEELMEQLLALGFRKVELNYRVKPQWLPAIEKYISSGLITAVSVHNVFPETGDERFGTDSVLLGYEDENLRRRAVELGCRSIDHACRLGAGAVVFHPTEVPLPPEEFDVPLKKMIAAHKTGGEEYMLLRSKMIKLRQAEPYLNQMLKSIEELCGYVTKNSLPVRLGMENRAMCHQVPIFSEFEIIADRFDGSPAGIWLDTGHAIMMMEMGLQALPLSARVAKNIVGMHIHDAADGLDHYSPCTLPGSVLEPFREYIQSSPIRVLELSGRLSAEEILTGTDRFVREYGLSR